MINKSYKTNSETFQISKLDKSYRESLYKLIINNHLKLSKTEEILKAQINDVPSDFPASLTDEEYEKNIYFGLFSEEDTKKEKIIGCIGLKPKDNIQSTVISFSVNEDYRKKGIGSFLLESLLSYAKNELNLKKLDLIVIDMSEHAVRIYEKFGFILVNTKYIQSSFGVNNCISYETYSDNTLNDKFRLFTYEKEL